MHTMVATHLQDSKLGQGLMMSYVLIDKFALTDHIHHSHIIISLIFLLILLFLYIVMFVLRSWLGLYSNAVKSTVVFYESKDPTKH